MTASHADIVFMLASSMAIGDDKLPIERRDRLAAHFARDYPQGLAEARRRAVEALEDPSLDTDTYEVVVSVIDEAIALIAGQPTEED